MCKPIIFSSAMVIAILRGIKTQTRRVAKINLSGNVKMTGGPKNWHPDDPNAVKACPWQPGDRLWVREAFSETPPCCLGGREQKKIWYRADNDRPTWAECRWKPSIHMPRCASRITIEVVSVRLEYLQNISEEDAIAEGIERVGGWSSCCPWRNYLIDRPNEMNKHASAPIRSYQTLWDMINKQRGISWETNPLVWVIEFRRVDLDGEMRAQKQA